MLDRHFAEAAVGRGTALRVYGAEGVGRRRLLDESATRWLENPAGPVFLGGEAEPGLSEGLGMPFSHMLLDWYLRGDRPDSPNVPDRLAVRVQREGGMAEEDAVNLAAVISGAATDHSSEVRADLLARGLLQLTATHPVVLRVDRPPSTINSTFSTGCPIAR